MAEATIRGVKLHYQRIGREGAATRVVFLHGLVMDNLSSWYFSIAPAVAEYADVLLFDLRGHGRSERPPSGYAVTDMVDDTVALISAVLGSGPVTLVGNSFGALLALRVALHPDMANHRIAKLVLVDGHLGSAGFGARMAETLSLEGEARDQAIAASFQHWLGRNSERKRTRLADHARALVEGTSLIRDLEATPPLGVEDVRKIRIPSIALYGAQSDVLDESRPLIEAMPHATLQIFSDCSHSLLWEATAELRTTIARFCRDDVDNGEASAP